MPVPSLAWWQKKTSSVWYGRKNPLVKDIDILLAEYHNPAKTDVQRQKILILLLYYVTTWLVSKSGQTSWKRKYVLSLRDDVAAELRSQAMATATQTRLAGPHASGVQMKADPVELLQPRDLSQKFGLGAGVNVQRVYDPSAQVNAFLNDNTLQGYASKLQNEIAQGGGAPDYVDSLQILAAQGAGGQQLKVNLEYLSKTDRVACQLTWGKSKLFYLAGSDVPYQTEPEGALYVMDTAEFIYVHPHAKRGAFHHSSFLSAKPVICGGSIKVRNGAIKDINNSSGHYKPSTAALIQCVTVLRDQYEVDLQGMTVEDVTTKPYYKWKSAVDFLAKNGVPPQRTAK